MKEKDNHIPGLYNRIFFAKKEYYTREACKYCNGKWNGNIFSLERLKKLPSIVFQNILAVQFVTEKSVEIPNEKFQLITAILIYDVPFVDFIPTNEFKLYAMTISEFLALWKARSKEPVDVLTVTDSITKIFETKTILNRNHIIKIKFDNDIPGILVLRKDHRNIAERSMLIDNEYWFKVDIHSEMDLINLRLVLIELGLYGGEYPDINDHTYIRYFDKNHLNNRHYISRGI